MHSLLRSPLGPFAISASLLALLGLIGGCSVAARAIGTGDDPDAAGLTPYEWQPSDASASVGSDSAAGDAGARAYEGSPLCNALKSTARCFPDDPTATGCEQEQDAAAAGDAAIDWACRAGPSIAAGPICTVAGNGKDGDACQRGTDCAAGFECVGNGQCRRYCCENLCPASGSRPAFCDIQPTAESSSRRVPVCTPVRSCKLLTEGYCGPNETCAVVRADGTTSCVARGSVPVGGSCDEEHCAAGLVCLGPLGSRKCFQLCRTAADDCKTATTKLQCRAAAPLFPDPAVGICEK